MLITEAVLTNIHQHFLCPLFLFSLSFRATIPTFIFIVTAVYTFFNVILILSAAYLQGIETVHRYRG